MIWRLWSLAWLLRSQRWQADRIAAYQEQHLLATLRHAVESVPYYRSLGIVADSLRTAADLGRFPVLTKADVQRLGAELLADGVEPAQCAVSRTSGSTGQPTETYFCKRSWALQKGPVKWRRSLTGGISIPERVLVVGEGPSPAADRPSRTRPLPLPLAVERLSVHAPFAEQVEFTRRWRPTTLYAYPSWYVELLDHCERRGETAPAVRRLFTSSEVLTPATRERIESGFRGRVFDVYGSTEFKEVAAECEYGRRHLIFETTFVEMLQPLEPGDRPSLAMTTLVNRAMPLIRYAIGDFGRLSSTSCACGRAAPVLTELRGREVDFLEGVDGSRASPYVISTIVERHPAIARYQIFQARPGSIEVRFLRRPGRPDAVPGDALRRELSDVLVNRGVVSFVEARTLERSPSGKHRLLIRDGTHSIHSP